MPGDALWWGLTIAILSAVVVLGWWWSRSWLGRRVKRVVTVHTIEGSSLEGVLADVCPDGIVLRNASYLDASSPVPLDGEVFIPRAKVGFLQIREAQ